MRGVTDISGLRDIRSHRSIGRRSLPRFQSSAYLGLYMLRVEKERLEKELALIERRRKEIEKRLLQLQREMEVLERLAQADRLNNGVKNGAEPSGFPKKKWKAFALKY